VIGQGIWTVVVRLLLIAAGFVSSVITARFLGPEGRGVFFYWMILAGLVIQFGNLGLHSSNTYYLAKGQARLGVLAANSLCVSAVAGAVLGALLAGALWFQGQTLQDKWSFLLPTLLMIPAGLYFLLGTNLLVALGRIGEYNAFELGNRYLALATILIAAWYWRTPEALLAAVAIVTAVTCLPLYRRLRVLGGKEAASLPLIRRGWSYAMRAYLAATLGFLVLRVNALLLERYSDAATLGTWSIAAQLLDVFNVIPGAIALVLLPRIMRAHDPYRLMQSQLQLVAGVLALACILAVWLGRGLIGLIYGERFMDAYDMLLWGLPGAFCLGLISIVSQYLAAQGIPPALVWIWLGALAIETLCAFHLIPGYGGRGAMAALSATYIVILGLVWGLAFYIGHGYRRQGSAERS
jgi:O-antigen/teichoic acid export membrane protein